MPPSDVHSSHESSPAITIESVRAERIAQGLPATITDPATLAVLAAALRPAATDKRAAA